MAVLLPLAAFGLLFLILLGRKPASDDSAVEWRRPFLNASLIWGGIVVVLTELLNLGSWLTRNGIAAAWAVVLFVLIVTAYRIRSLPRSLSVLRTLPRRQNRGDMILAGSVIVILVSLFVVAVVAPPNNNDSLLYHMARVVHWAQSYSLAHYPTANEPQLFNPIWAEITILNLRALWGNDRLANLVQWFSALGSLIGVSGIAATLGAGRKGQWLAVAFALSVPMGLLQATSTQNDYVTSFWLVCLAYYTLLGSQRRLAIGEILGFGLAFGLGLLTKGTYYPLAIPFLVWFVLSQWPAAGRKRMVASMAMIAGIAVVLNAGYWIRNTITFGGPLGPTGWVKSSIIDWGGPGHPVALILRNIMLNFATPSEHVNGIMVEAVNTILARLGDPPNFDPIWFWNHEDLAGSPIHLLIVPVVGIAALGRLRIPRIRRIVAYSIATLASFVCLAWVVRIGHFEIRYQLPFFVAWAPVVGVVAATILRDRFVSWLAMLLILMSLPWLLLNDTRPLIGWKPRTATDSILLESPVRILLANWPEKIGPYTQAVDQVKGRGCKEVGLRIDSHDPEYALWWLFEAPESGTRLEVISFDDPLLARYVDPHFKPCAIICTVCGKRERLHGLPLVGQYRSVAVFAGPDYLPGEND